MLCNCSTVNFASCRWSWFRFLLNLGCKSVAVYSQNFVHVQWRWFSGYLFCADDFCVHHCQDLSRLVYTGFGMTRYLHACWLSWVPLETVEQNKYSRDSWQIINLLSKVCGPIVATSNSRETDSVQSGWEVSYPVSNCEPHILAFQVQTQCKTHMKLKWRFSHRPSVFCKLLNILEHEAVRYNSESYSLSIKNVYN